MTLPLSVLDLSPIASGRTPSSALHESIELARTAEAAGYQRFWVAEHHNMPGIASSAPEVMIASVAAATSTIRVGAGGIMLPNHAPLKVAETFRVLAGLHPGRIDLGIGRAPGTDQRTALALRRTVEGLSAEDFPRELFDLIGLFGGGEDAPPILARPGRGDRPAIWLLGSSGYSAQLAGLLGLPFSFAHHFSAANTEPALALYRQNFRPSAVLDKPLAMVCVAVICADSDEQAQFLGGPARVSFAQLRSGQPKALITPQEAASYEYSPAEQMFVRDRFAGQAVGSPETVRGELQGLLDRTQADELMLTTMVYDIKDRARSFELVAGKVAGGLARPAP